MDSYFDTCGSSSLCRGGGNGPNHPSQRRGLWFVKKYDSLLDVGCGSATTLDAVRKWKKTVKYTGMDEVEKHVKWCQGEYPDHQFKVGSIEDIPEPANSYDVVWARHVIDHCEYYEKPIKEMLRVAKKRVIITLWYNFQEGDNPDSIKPVIAEDKTKTFKDSWLNQYNRKKFMNFIINLPNTKLIHFEKIIGQGIKGEDTLIVLEKE